MNAKNKNPITEFLKYMESKAIINPAEYRSRQNAYMEKFHLPPLMSHGVLFVFDDDYFKLWDDCLSYVWKKIPKNKISSGEIDKVLIEFSAKQFTAKKDKTQCVIKKLNCISSTELKHILPNCAIILEEDINDFNIGPVKVIPTNKLKETYPCYFKNIEVKIADSNFGVDLRTQENESNILKLPYYSFIFTLQCSQGSADGLAEFYAEIALSLLRLYILYITQTDDSRFPYDKEPFLFNFREEKKISYTFNATTKTTSGWGFKSYPSYHLTKEIIGKITMGNSVSENSFAVVCDKIFYPDKDDIGQLLQLALSWLTKARTAIRAADKILFLFTALEAILTNGKDSIADSIARYISLMTIKSEHRSEHYKRIKKLYAIRSNIVHKGHKDVPSSAASELQYYAEWCCIAIIDSGLNMRKDDFHQLLKQASIENVWPPKKADKKETASAPAA